MITPQRTLIPLTASQRAHLATLAKRDNGRVCVAIDCTLITRPNEILKDQSNQYTWDHDPKMARFIQSNFQPLEEQATPIRRALPIARRRAQTEARKLTAKLPAGAGRTYIETMISPGWPFGIARDTLLNIIESISGLCLTDAECARLRDSIWTFWDCDMITGLPLGVYDLNKPLRAVN